MKKIGILLLRIVKLGLVAGLGMILILVGINLHILVTSYQDSYQVRELELTSWAQEEVPILILGAGVINNESPSPILANRLDKGIEAYQTYPNKTLIMSGDHLEDNYNEVAVMKAYAMDQGVASEDIYLDHLGLSTYASLVRAKELHQTERLIIVSQSYHLPRALFIARQLGIEAIGLPAKDTGHNYYHRLGREFLACIKDFMVTQTSYPAEEVSMEYGLNLNCRMGT